MLKTVTFKSIISILLCASMLSSMQPLSASNQQNTQQSYYKWTKNGIKKGARFVWDHKVEIACAAVVLTTLYFGFRNSGGDAQPGDKKSNQESNPEELNPKEKKASKVWNAVHKLSWVEDKDPSNSTKPIYPFATKCKAILRNNNDTSNYEETEEFIHFGKSFSHKAIEERSDFVPKKNNEYTLKRSWSLNNLPELDPLSNEEKKKIKQNQTMAKQFNELYDNYQPEDSND